MSYKKWFILAMSIVTIILLIWRIYRLDQLNWQYNNSAWWIGNAMNVAFWIYAYFKFKRLIK